MSYGDQVVVKYMGLVQVGTVTYEYDFGKIVHLPITNEQRLFSHSKIQQWSKLNWITKMELMNYDSKSRVKKG